VPELVATQDYEPRNRPWYVRAVERKQETWSPVFTDFRLKFLGISLSKPVYTADHVLLGVATSSIGLLRLGKILEKLPPGKNGVSFIVEPSGEFIATSDAEAIYKVGSKRQQFCPPECGAKQLGAGASGIQQSG